MLCSTVISSRQDREEKRDIIGQGVVVQGLRARKKVIIEGG